MLALGQYGGNVFREERMKSLFALRNTAYVPVRPDSLSVLHVKSGAAYADVPSSAVANKGGKHAYPEALK